MLARRTRKFGTQRRKAAKGEKIFAPLREPFLVLAFPG
jgi:hypothetical protein